MRIDIRIPKDKVYEKATVVTEYVGSRTIGSDGNSMYDSIALTGYDHPVTDLFWDEISNLLSEPVRPFIIYLDNTATEISFGLNLPGNFIVAFVEPIKDAVYEFAVNSMLAKWFDLVHKPEVPKYAAMAEGNLAELRNKLYARKAPGRVAVK